VRRSARGAVVDFAELSSPGHDPAKQVNEDSSGFVETPLGLLAVVCDGMGGHYGGQQASQAAIATIIERVQQAQDGDNPSEVLKDAIEAAGRAVYAIGGDAAIQFRPGSTCVAVLIGEGGGTLAHVGDSRLYLIRDAQSYRMTRDHSMVQQMVDAGVIAPEEAAVHPDSNKITRALGMTPEVEVDVYPRELPLTIGDVVLLATDGLTDLVTDQEIALIARRVTEPDALSRELVQLALDRGGHDNITVQALRVEQIPARVVSGPQPTLIDPGTAPSTASPPPAMPTLPDAAQAATIGAPPPSPTLVDDSPGRTTEPGLSPAAARAGERPRFVDHAPSIIPWPAQRGGRALFVVAALLSAVIVVAVSTWWLLGRERRPSAEDTPPPEPSPAERARQRPTGAGSLAPAAPVSIEPNVEPVGEAIDGATIPMAPDAATPRKQDRTP